MRAFTLAISLPALVGLLAWALRDRAIGSQRLWRGIAVGGMAGLAAAFGYDLFRLPFVSARDLGIERVVPPLPLFKVFPRFGAMILGQPLEQSVYAPLTQLVGWAYHFSNGLAFGIMYLALVGDANRRHWAWAVVFAVALELGMLFTPTRNSSPSPWPPDSWWLPWPRIWSSGSSWGWRWDCRGC
jgi:hypothetical protein